MFPVVIITWFINQIGGSRHKYVYLSIYPYLPIISDLSVVLG
jgi:hypothetical protein